MNNIESKLKTFGIMIADNQCVPIPVVLQTTTTSEQQQQNSISTNTLITIGVVAGGSVLVILLIIVFVCCCKKKKLEKKLAQKNKEGLCYGMTPEQCNQFVMDIQGESINDTSFNLLSDVEYMELKELKTNRRSSGTNSVLNPTGTVRNTPTSSFRRINGESVRSNNNDLLKSVLHNNNNNNNNNSNNNNNNNNNNNKNNNSNNDNDNDNNNRFDSFSTSDAHEYHYECYSGSCFSSYDDVIENDTTSNTESDLLYHSPFQVDNGDNYKNNDDNDDEYKNIPDNTTKTTTAVYQEPNLELEYEKPSNEYAVADELETETRLDQIYYNKTTELNIELILDNYKAAANYVLRLLSQGGFTRVLRFLKEKQKQQYYAEDTIKSIAEKEKKIKRCLSDEGRMEIKKSPMNRSRSYSKLDSSFNGSSSSNYKSKIV
eukprot:Pgem_evm1s19673